MVLITKPSPLLPIQKFIFDKRSPIPEGVINSNTQSAERASHEDYKGFGNKSADVSGEGDRSHKTDTTENKTQESRHKLATAKKKSAEQSMENDKAKARKGSGEDSGHEQRAKVEVRHRPPVAVTVPIKSPTKDAVSKDEGENKVNFDEEPKRTGCSCLFL